MNTKSREVKKEMDWEAEQDMLKGEAEQIAREQAEFEADAQEQWEAEQEARYSQEGNEPY